MHTVRKFRRFLRVVGALAVIGILWIAWVQWKIHAGQSIGTKERVDAGIVLGAAMWGATPSPGLKERLEHSLQLYREGRFAKFIVTGGLDTDRTPVTEAEGMKRYLLSRGVPQGDILLEPKARSTYQNLVFSQKIMEDNGLRTAVIITHDYHGARAGDIAKFIGMKNPQVDTCGTKVMNKAWNRVRETLAFSNWELNKLLLRTGLSSGSDIRTVS
jgi:uncharacterized SAM-binding protein YcdF (DUF218 family)